MRLRGLTGCGGAEVLSAGDRGYSPSPRVLSEVRAREATQTARFLLHAFQEDVPLAGNIALCTRM